MSLLNVELLLNFFFSNLIFWVVFRNFNPCTTLVSQRWSTLLRSANSLRDFPEWAYLLGLEWSWTEINSFTIFSLYSFLLHDDKPFKNTKFLLKFYNYDLWQSLLLLLLNWNNLRIVNIECILSKQYYLEKWSTFKCRSQTL